MAKRASLVCVAALACLCNMWRLAFLAPVPQPGGSQLTAIPVATAASVAGAFGISAGANADAIDDAAKKLAAAAYPFLQEIPWNSDIYASLPKSTSIQITKALEKIFLHGAAMDPGATKTAALAHSKAIANMDAKGVTTLADFEATVSGIGHMIASAPDEKAMDVYNAFVPLIGRDIPAHLLSTVNPTDAEAAYQALMEFKDVVKASGR